MPLRPRAQQIMQTRPWAKGDEELGDVGNAIAIALTEHFDREMQPLLRRLRDLESSIAQLQIGTDRLRQRIGRVDTAEDGE